MAKLKDILRDIDARITWPGVGDGSLSGGASKQDGAGTTKWDSEGASNWDGAASSKPDSPETTNRDSAGTTGPGTLEITSLCIDSRAASPGALFFALKGTLADGHDHIAHAIAGGAVAVVCQSVPEEPDPAICYVQVADSQACVGPVASAFYGDPSSKLRLVGVTGTNGKTTTATLLSDLFRTLGYKTGLISTVAYRIGSRSEPATHTTPDAIKLNTLLAEMVEAGCEYCFMEVSSHSVVQRRIEGLKFAGGLFTNITHDHLDYHGTFADYIKAKKGFFDALPPSAFALVNADDRNAKVMVQNTRAKVYDYSLTTRADFSCRIAEMHFDGMLLVMGHDEVWVRLLGRFNAYNLLCVYACALLLGAQREEVLMALSALGSVEGRFEHLRSAGGVNAIVDYAHTPDALQNVIDTINEIRTGGQRLISVVGCGGNRDASKRPVMGRIAAAESHTAILTSDNPRLEDPLQIIEQMKGGITGGSYLAIADRREAIRTAVRLAREGDIILVAGKGHETYQDAAGAKSHFDDRKELRNAFGEL